MLNDITNVIRSRNLNIRNIVGNNYAILIEIEGEVDSELINNIGDIDGVNTVNVINLSFTILGFVQENFMRALGVIALVNVQFMPNRTVISIAKSFDEDVGMPMTKGIIRGLFEALGNVKYYVKIEKRDFYRDIIIT